jgi:hypothetical protein
MAAPLTRVQLETIDYWRKHYNSFGYWPTLRKAAEDLGVTVNAVRDRVRYTEKKGYFKQREKDGRWMLIVRRKKVSGE